MYCWGYNHYGQLGNGQTTNSLYPSRVLLDSVSTFDNVSHISAGSAFNCAMDSSHRTYCWGLNAYGSLGTNNSNNRYPARVQSDANSYLNNVIDISAGRGYTWYWNNLDILQHTCTVKDDGTVWCWGYNNNGELGDNTTNSSSYPVRTYYFGI